MIVKKNIYINGYCISRTVVLFYSFVFIERLLFLKMSIMSSISILFNSFYFTVISKDYGFHNFLYEQLSHYQLRPTEKSPDIPEAKSMYSLIISLTYYRVEYF